MSQAPAPNSPHSAGTASPLDYTPPPPVAVDDTNATGVDYWTYHDSELWSPGSVQDNDYSSAGSATTELVANVQHGQLTLNPDGTFEYMPDYHFSGIDSFTYDNVDAFGTSNVAMVDIRVAETKPTASDDGIDAAGNYLYQVSWNETALDNNIFMLPGGTNSLDNPPPIQSNDLDPDGPDTNNLISVLDTLPPNGYVYKYSNPSQAGIDPDGGFVYVPMKGFSGIDSFTYHDTDGILSSDSVTVSILVQKVDITLYDGGHPDTNGDYVPGNVVPPDKELSRGGYAVANWNDTNGDFTSDNAEQPVSAGFDGRGYNEYDLMKLVIDKPSPAIPGSTLVFQATNGLDIWQTPNKVPFLNNPPQGNPDQGELWNIPIDSLPITAYIEAVRRGASLKDMYVTAQFGVATDRINVTGIWADATSITTGEYTQDELKQLYPDLEPSQVNTLALGTGVHPTVASGTYNFLVMQYTVHPLRGPNDGTWENDNIFFDPTRQVDLRVYYKHTVAGDWALDSGTSKTWPRKVEWANDDPFSAGESTVVTPAGHVYAIDTPGWPPDNAGDDEQLQLKMNAVDFLRVEIDSGSKVSGNGWLYSRGSDYFAWHSEVWVVKDANGNLVRNPNGSGGPSLHNEIGEGANLDLGFPF